MRGEGVCAVVWSQDGRWVVSGGGDGVVKVFARQGVGGTIQQDEDTTLDGRMHRDVIEYYPRRINDIGEAD
ncbi:hypothetical protein PC116_g29865 [Phytophthora cactorum]|nr:hypothetical protein PC116_g29865 [Phytophthora cactorum]